LRGDHGGRVPRSPAFTARGYSKHCEIGQNAALGNDPECRGRLIDHLERWPGAVLGARPLSSVAVVTVRGREL
jgi:hypothetical protein